MKHCSYCRMLAAGLAMLAFVHCSKEDDTPDNNETVVPDEQVLRSFDARYPSATGVVWFIEEGYYVADFTLNGQMASAWFIAGGEWTLGKIPISYHEQIEPVVAEALSHTSYATWEVKEAYILNRKELSAIYTVNVTNSRIFSNLYFTRNGDFIKVIDDVNGRTDMPVTIPAALTSAIDKLFEWVEIVDISVIDVVNSEISVGMLKNGVYLTAIFSKNYKWIVNFWNLTPQTVPETVWKGFEASVYAGLPLSRIRSMENATATTYLFYLIRNNKTIIIEFNSDGRLTTVISRDHVMARYLLTI